MDMKPWSAAAMCTVSARRKLSAIAVDVQDTSIRCIFSSEMRHIGRVTDRCRYFLMESGIVRSDDVTLVLDVALVLRELLANAIVHGNRSEAERKVRCSVERLPDLRLKITVEDEGGGFDYRSLDMNLPLEPRHAQNRGFALLNALADQIEFNETGNQISAYIALDRKRPSDTGRRTWTEEKRKKGEGTTRKRKEAEHNGG